MGKFILARDADETPLDKHDPLAAVLAHETRKIPRKVVVIGIAACRSALACMRHGGSVLGAKCLCFRSHGFRLAW